MQLSYNYYYLRKIMVRTCMLLHDFTANSIISEWIGINVHLRCTSLIIIIPNPLLHYNNNYYRNRLHV